jgi:hypothetical protein
MFPASAGTSYKWSLLDGSMINVFASDPRAQAAQTEQSLKNMEVLSFRVKLDERATRAIPLTGTHVHCK